MSDPALFDALFDDAALFPPGNAPMVSAVPGHRTHRAGPHAPQVGTFIVPAARLGELGRVLAESPADHVLRLGLTVPGGPAELPAALDAVRRIGGAHPGAVELAAVELASAPGADPRAGVDLAASALAASLPPGVRGCVEVPRGTDPVPLTAALAGHGVDAKFRTGGVQARAFPSESELAAALHAAVAAPVRFKCTAGLHRAVRHTGAATGFEHHGFLNVLVAACRALAGADRAQTAAALAERDGAALAGALPDSAAAVAVRAAFAGFGTCSIDEPVADLIALGLLPPDRP